MANMLSVYKRKVSLALKIETIARMDAKAEADGSTRNASALSKIRLSADAQAKVKAEIEANKKARKGR